MEIRQTLRENSVPKGLIVLLAISVAVALAAMGTAIAKDLRGSGASVNSATYHAAPGTVLRQDNPAQGSAPVVVHTGRSSGTQIVGDDSGLSAGFGPQSDLTRALPSQAPASQAGWDPRSPRGGHGV